MAGLQMTCATARNRDFGYFHLTENGWIRKDTLPYPENRIETWSYEAERPHADDKERVRLTRIWCAPHVPEYRRDALRLRSGNAILPSEDRHIVIDCLA